MSTEIGIVTKDRPDTLPLVLASIISQSELPKKVIVLDNSEQFASTRSFTFRCMLDLLAVKNIEVIYKRVLNPMNVVEARAELIKMADSDFLLLLDDDTFMEIDVISKLLETINKYNCPWVVPVQVLPNNEGSFKDYINPLNTSKSGIYNDNPFYKQYFLQPKAEIPMESFTVGVSLLRVKDLVEKNVLQALIELSKELNTCELATISGLLGKGYLRTDAVTWHLVQGEQFFSKWDIGIFDRLSKCLTSEKKVNKFINLLGEKNE